MGNKKTNSKSQKALAKERVQTHKKMIIDENKYAKVDKIAPNDSYVILRNVNKIYDNHVQAVFNFNLDIKEKEFIVFVGPSGCGKSTTLRMIAGLEDITYGDLFIGGKYCNLAHPKDRDLAMVFQNYALYPHMSVYQNMAFGIKIRKHKVPCFEPSQYDEVEKEQIDLRNRIVLLNKQARVGKRNADEIEVERKEVLAKLDEVNAKLKDLEPSRVPVQEINNKRINQLIKENISFKKILDKYNSSTEDLDEDEKIETEAKKADIINTIAKNEKEIEYLKVTPVQTFKNVLLKKYEIDEKVQDAARILDLGPYLTRKPAALSGGQRQRVALGRAIVRNAGLFLMDEPLSNLDAKLRVQMRSEIVTLHNRIGATTIYVTHDQTEAMTMASRIVVMKDGHIQQIGTPIEIYDHPSNTFVAGFIGSPAMNIFQAKIKKGDLKLSKDFEVKLSKERLAQVEEFAKKSIENNAKKIANIDRMIEKGNAKGNLSEGNKELFNSRKETYQTAKARMEAYLAGEEIDLFFGIRAEDIISGQDAIKFTELSKPYSATAIVAEFLGHEYYVHFNFGETKIVAKVPVTKDLLKVGDKVDVMFNMDKAHLFEFDSKETIF